MRPQLQKIEVQDVRWWWVVGRWRKHCRRSAGCATQASLCTLACFWHPAQHIVCCTTKLGCRSPLPAFLHDVKHQPALACQPHIALPKVRTVKVGTHRCPYSSIMSGTSARMPPPLNSAGTASTNCRLSFRSTRP